jgi:hypothetical protein
MSTPFSEIVIEGPFMLVKGFLLGFLSNKSVENPYFFHRKAGIKRDTLRDFLKELFELDNYAHLCLRSDLVNDFEKATEFYTKITGMKIKSVKPIKSASFNFAYELFSEEIATEAKSLIQNLPEDIKIDGYKPIEEKDESGAGMEAYAPLHEFVSRGKGTVKGEFSSIIDLFLKIKRSKISESFITSEITLEF